MKLVDELFKRYKVKEELLPAFGFAVNDGAFRFTKTISNGAFNLIITVKDKKISGELIDTDFGDRYNQIDNDVSGSFIAELKRECSELLLSLREKCFYKENFIFSQSNRITARIKEKYGTGPEFLWDKFPAFGVFRNKINDKWFGIIMNIDKSKIVPTEKGEIEIINVKSEDVPETLKTKGIYPAYHMNKKSWVSVVLDDTLSDEQVFSLIEKSFEIISK